MDFSSFHNKYTGQYVFPPAVKKPKVPHKSILVWPITARYYFWPEGMPADVDLNDTWETEDTHASEDEAEGVCRLARRTGFGGFGKIFPISVRVEPIVTT